MQTPTWKSICAMLCLLLLLPAALPVKAAAETAPAKVVRVGSFEDTFNYVNEKGIRKGYGYELLQTLSGYTGWQFEYVTCDWSDCFENSKRRNRHYGRYFLCGGPHRGDAVFGRADGEENITSTPIFRAQISPLPITKR